MSHQGRSQRQKRLPNKMATKALQPLPLPPPPPLTPTCWQAPVLQLWRAPLPFGEASLCTLNISHRIKLCIQVDNPRTETEAMLLVESSTCSSFYWYHLPRNGLPRDEPSGHQVSGRNVTFKQRFFSQRRADSCPERPKVQFPLAKGLLASFSQCAQSVMVWVLSLSPVVQFTFPSSCDLCTQPSETNLCQNTQVDFRRIHIFPIEYILSEKRSNTWIGIFEHGKGVSFNGFDCSSY